MLRVYFLEVELIDNVETVRGQSIIHNAILDATWDKDVRKLLMDTTDTEHITLSSLALSFREPTPEEEATFSTHPILPGKDKSTIRAEKLLTHSLTAATLPEAWELLQIISSKLGIQASKEDSND